ncbi:sensor histidine kinase [Streptomyces olivochromogenes]|uniref:sensor histidine kinase n=1 Tax=Streptomyces olivochromogenes TaxID=1963 RepID=UPI001F3702E2|nr:HAMP domain-containing sensor histidine kinase [Streptomyces olivochromogenes]MCF3128807.1 HAMP domain-containing histidine kinase [Streptomyces olivochromogenes]
MRRSGVPLHTSLFVRLLAASLLVALCSVAATTWVAVTTTTQAISTEQGRSSQADARIYDALIGYSATHTDWGGVQPLVRDLAARTGRAITLTTPARTPLAGSEPTMRIRQRPAASVDPLRLDPVLSHESTVGPIDPRAVGPFLLEGEDRDRVRAIVHKITGCLAGPRIATEVVPLPTGRYSIRFTGHTSHADELLTAQRTCDFDQLKAPVPSEVVPLRQASDLASECLNQQGRPSVEIFADFSWHFTGHTKHQENSDRAAQECVYEGRRQQLRPYVSPPVLLFVSDRGHPTTETVRLSSENTVRIAGAAGIVLTVTCAVTILLGSRLVRPLRALITAAQRPADEAARVPVLTKDEIGRVALAFNDLSERRETLERQRRAMVSDVAHELRTPLTNIRSWLEAAQDGLTPTDQPLLALLLDEAMLLQHIIEDLRDLAAAEAGNLVLHREALSVRHVLEQVAVAHHGAAGPAGVELSIQAADELAVHADPVRLRQAIGNLVSNAIRHTPSGGRVVLRSRSEGNELILEVIDTGCGIQPADLPHVFDRFWRADKSRNRQTGGSGLGLAITRKLTEAHDGTISVISTPGIGSVFTVRLPWRPCAGSQTS